MGQIFTDCVKKALPNSVEKVLHQIQECHGGTLKDSRFGIRNRGKGRIASQIQDLVKLAKRRYFCDKVFTKLNTELHEKYKP